MLDAFAQAKKALPELQLVVVGALPGEGPQDFRIAREVSDYAAGMDDAERADGRALVALIGAILAP